MDSSSPVESSGDSQQPTGRGGVHDRTVSNAKRVAVFTLASRVLGLVRDQALAFWLGNSLVQDRFVYGFIIPNVFRRLFGEGALSAAFVPTLASALREGGDDEGRRVYAAVATLLCAALAVVTAVIECVLLSVLMFVPMSPGLQLGFGLTAAMLPFAPLICLTALMGSCLNVLGRFGWPAAMPILMNVVQIAAIGVLAASSLQQEGVVSDGINLLHARQVYWLAGAVVLSGLVQAAALGLVLGRLGYPLRPSWQPGHPAVRQIAVLMAPTIIGLGVLQLEPVIDGQIILWLSAGGERATVHLFGYEVPCPLEEGSQSAVAQAQRLYQFPLGLLAISLATAVFPALARHVAAGDFAALRFDVGRSLRLAVFEGLPAGVGLMLLAEPITRLLFEYGAYTARDTQMASWVLVFYAAGLWAFCCQHMLMRGFYALKDPRTPLRVGVLMVLANVLLNLVLVWTPLNVGAFGLSTAVTSSAGVVVLAVLLTRKMQAASADSATPAGTSWHRELLLSFARTAACTLALAGGVLAAWRMGQPTWRPWLSEQFAAQPMLGELVARLADVAVPMAAGGACFVGLALALKSSELNEILGRRARSHPTFAA